MVTAVVAAAAAAGTTAADDDDDDDDDEAEALPMRETATPFADPTPPLLIDEACGPLRLQMRTMFWMFLKPYAHANHSKHCGNAHLRKDGEVNKLPRCERRTESTVTVLSVTPPPSARAHSLVTAKTASDADVVAVVVVVEVVKGEVKLSAGALSLHIRYLGVILIGGRACEA